MVEIKEIITERVLAPTQIQLADYVINPYRGCSFGCLYCYSQKNKNICRQKNKEYLGVKINAPEKLKEELKKKKPKKVLLGSTAEAFQDIEKKYQISSRILSILNQSNTPYLILTKSSQIQNHLGPISKNKENEIFFTLNFSDQKTINIFEKKSSPLSERLKTIKKIIAKKIKLRVHIGPFIPYLSNLEDILAVLPHQAKKINLEIYNNKMGNFKEIKEKTEKNFGIKTAKKLAAVYANKENYQNCQKEIKKKLLETGRKKNIIFFYIGPGYNQYYNPKINYKQRLK